MGSKFVDDAVAAHNVYRAKHKVGPLTKAKDLCEYAQKWADNIAKSGNFRHSDCMHKGERLGENIAMKYTSSGDPFTGQQVTDQWYSEVAKYTFGSDFSSGTGHFTQVVWKGSKEVGLGQAKAKDGKIFVVASYRPAGNMMGQFKDNVFKPDGPIVLPKKEEPKPMTFRSFGGADGSQGDSGMTRIVHTKTMPTTTSTQRTVRTVTNQGGPQTVSRMVVTETKTGPNGETITTTKETINGKETTTTKVTRKGEF